VATARIDCAHRATGTVRILRTGGVAAGRGAVNADTGISGRSGADATVVVATRDESSAVRGGAAWGYWNSRGLAMAGAARLTIAARVAASAAVFDVGLEVLASIGCSTAERGGSARAWANGCGGSSGFSGSGNRRFGKSGLGNSSEFRLGQSGCCSDEHGFGHERSFGESGGRSDILSR
jgi:hypothetical protein